MRTHDAPGGAAASELSGSEDDATQTLAEELGRRVPLAVCIRVLNAPAKPAVFRLSRGVCRVGAGRGVDILVDDKTVSRVHAELELVREGVAVRDLGSRNGTFFHGQRVERAVLSPGTGIRLGKVELEFAADLSPELLPLSESTSYGRLYGASPVMRRLFSLLARLEGSLVNVVVSGETGTGKELVARAIHERSEVAGGPFVSVNCGALDPNLARSELFGHVRGAFTGAMESRPGAFESASAGTLFLDEIGELPLAVQPLLLRALEQAAVVRVGETQERPVKVRLIAATNRDLRQLVARERFREDLFYRLMVVEVAVPPLRERGEDIALLVEHFTRELGAEPLPEEVVERIQAHRFPGNVRELKNAVQAYAAVGALPDTLQSDGSELISSLKRSIDFARPYAVQKDALLKTFLDLYVDALLSYTRGNQSEAARISGLERSYLNRILRRRRGIT